MGIVSIPRNFFKIYDYSVRNEIFDKFRGRWEPLLSEKERLRSTYKMSFGDLSKQFKFSRTTYYRKRSILRDLIDNLVSIGKPPRRASISRRWSVAEIDLVLKIRRKNPTYGKAKIAVILKRDHNFQFSESTVGRILDYLKDKGKITKSISAVRSKRKRNFKKHAEPQAWERKSKTLIAQIYSSAKSTDAKKFLQELVAKAPYKIKSIQVDGGSEFMADFEDECSKLRIPLYVLPPAIPKCNGGVERTNRILREEFYSNPKLLADSIGAMRIELQKMLKKYNEYRPHASLNGITPVEYIRNYSEHASLSQSI